MSTSCRGGAGLFRLPLGAFLFLAWLAPAMFATLRSMQKKNRTPLRLWNFYHNMVYS
jgi:hypothetical protein